MGPFTDAPFKSRFQYRCIGEQTTRYIDINELRRSPGRSLFTHVPDHWEHIHLYYNNPNFSSISIGYPEIIQPIVPVYDLDSLWFEFSPDNVLNVSLKDNGIPDYIKIFWRYQPSEDFLDVGADIQYGEVSRSVPRLHEFFQRKTTHIGSDDKWWIHIVFADTRNGGCVARKVEVETSDKQIDKWSYKRALFSYEVSK